LTYDVSTTTLFCFAIAQYFEMVNKIF